MFEMSRKVILSAVISFVSDPDVRLAVAYLISFGSLIVVVLACPFWNPSVNLYADTYSGVRSHAHGEKIC
jgi:hypothetical protein